MKAAIVTAISLVLVAVLSVLHIRHGGRSVRRQPRTVAFAAEKAAFEDAEAWREENRDDYDAIVVRFEQLLRRCEGTPFEEQVRGVLTETARERETAVDAVLAEISGEGEALVGEHRYDDAISLYENYDGRFAIDTQEARAELAGIAREKQTAKREAEVALRREQAEEKASLISGVVSVLVSKGAAAALGTLNAGMGEHSDFRDDAELNAVRELIGSASGVDARILDSFAAQEGELVSVGIRDAKVQLQIVGVSNGRVKALRKAGSGKDVGVTFSVGDLSVRERFSRMGSDTNSEVALLKGLYALSRRSGEHAVSCFGRVGTIIQPELMVLAGALVSGQSAQWEKAAEQQMRLLLRDIRIEQPGPVDIDRLVVSVQSVDTLSPLQMNAAKLGAGSFRGAYGQTAFGKKAVPVVEALLALSTGSAALVSRDGSAAPVRVDPVTPLCLPGKKGIGGAAPGGAKAERNLSILERLNVYWNYNWWHTRPTEQPDEIEHVPMVWGKRGHWSREAIGRILDNEVVPYIKRGKVKRLLGFNEPDKEKQANMPYTTALELWPELEKLDIPLCSPACANAEGSQGGDGSTQGVRGTWMPDFMAEVEKRGYRVDYIGVHWYGGPNAAQFKRKLTRVYEKYGKRPILLTEFAPADWSAGSKEDNRWSPAMVLDFMKEALPWLEQQDWIAGYAWFPFSIDDRMGTSALWDEDGNFTACGRYYASVTTENPKGDRSIKPDKPKQELR